MWHGGHEFFSICHKPLTSRRAPSDKEGRGFLGLHTFFCRKCIPFFHCIPVRQSTADSQPLGPYVKGPKDQTCLPLKSMAKAHGCQWWKEQISRDLVSMQVSSQGANTPKHKRAMGACIHMHRASVHTGLLDPRLVLEGWF